MQHPVGEYNMSAQIWPLLVIVLVVALQAGALELNEPCVNPRGEAGKCIFFRECQPLVAIFNKKPASIEEGNFVKQSRCGSVGGSAMVCCPGLDVENRGPGRATLPRPPQCGQDLSDRIFGGQPTDLDEFPWTALIQYRKPNLSLGFHCGGSLINSRYILTAAHCIRAIPFGWQVVGVRLGEYDTRNNGPDCKDNVCADIPVDMQIEKIIVHENYNPQGRNQYDDIALIRFTRDVYFSAFIKPICLPLGGNERNRNHIGTKGIAAGWGKTENKTASNEKLKVELNFVDLNQCASVYQPAGVTIRNSQLCAGGKRGQDTCSGDSGGPLMKRILANYFLYGIVSFGPNKCGTEHVPGVYTDVTKYIEWIESKME